MESPTAVIYDDQARPVIVRRAAAVRVVAGPDDGQHHPFGGRLRVGTAPGNDIVLTDNHVSRYHLELVAHDRGFLVRDLGSTNGVYYRGARIQQAVLGASAEVRLGATVLRLELGAETSQTVAARPAFSGLVGSSRPMQDLYGLLAAVAPTDATVLLEGETGTGKELVAEALHRESPRRDASFCVVDCGSIAESLIESELFGHERGAFTDALREREGIFERARGGTVFLDEIGELPLPLQSRLLRVLDRREVKRVGGDFPRKVDVRLVAATNRNLAEEVTAGRFREDLYYRLAVIRAVLPPLRDRPDDIPRLARHFLWQAGCPDPDSVLTPKMVELLSSRQWRGNVRELRNAVERAVLLSDGVNPFSLAPETGPQPLPQPPAWSPAPAPAATPISRTATVPGPAVPPDARDGDDARQPEVDRGDWLTRALPPRYLSRPFKEVKDELVRQLEAIYLSRLISEHGDNLSRIARAAGVDRQIIRRMLRRHGLELQSG